jgi:hypothetical protein
MPRKAFHVSSRERFDAVPIGVLMSAVAVVWSFILMTTAANSKLRQPAGINWATWTAGHTAGSGRSAERVGHSRRKKLTLAQ